jgi:hypothetical protein
MQEIRRFKPSTVSRRFSVVAGFYRTCVIDGLLEHSPAEHVRRPTVLPESPTLGFTHLQFEALLHRIPAASRWLRCSGCSACATSRPLGRTSPIWVMSTATGCSACAAKAPRSSSSRCHPRSAAPSTGQPAPAPAPDPAQQPRRPDGLPRRHPPSAATRRDSGVRICQATSAHAQAHLRHHHAHRSVSLTKSQGRRPASSRIECICSGNWLSDSCAGQCSR